MIARHFRISHATMLSVGAGWRIAEVEWPGGRVIDELPLGHSHKETALAVVAYEIIPKTPGPIVVYIDASIARVPLE